MKEFFIKHKKKITYISASAVSLLLAAAVFVTVALRTTYETDRYTVSSSPQVHTLTVSTVTEDISSVATESAITSEDSSSDVSSAVSSDVSSTVPKVSSGKTTSVSSKPPAKPKITDFSYDSTYANAVFLYDASTGETLFAKNPDGHVAPASLTKLATALTALKYVSFGTVFTVGDELSFLKKDSSVAGLKQGQQLTLEDLIAAMIIRSGNDAAYTVAVNSVRNIENNPEIPASEAVPKFMALVNDYCAELGLTDSNFVCPDGYDTKGHYSSARDIFRLSRAAYENKFISSFARMSSYSTEIISGETLTFINTNPFVSGSTPFEYANGLKTGFTDNAGYCLSVTAEKDEKTVFLIVMGYKKISRRNSEVLCFLKKAYGMELTESDLEFLNK